MKNWSEVFSQLTMVGQLGLSLVTPVLLCLFACYFLTTRLGLGAWVYVPGFIFGLGGAAMTAWKVWKAVEKKQKGEPEKPVSYDKHF